jgi:hypothetical protein
MENRKGLRLLGGSFAAASFVFLFVLSCVTSGCGAPGEPQPPSPPIPAPISDLAAHQQGNGVRLVFTLPGRTTGGDRLAEPPATEIFRGSLTPEGKPDNKSFRLVYTIPGALSADYAVQGKMQFTDPIPSEELGGHSGLPMVYRVRTRASKKKNSPDSNTVIVKLYPVADKIQAVNANVTQNAIELSWQAPKLAAEGSGETVTGYHVYRGELDASAPVPDGGDLSHAKWKNPLLLLAPVPGNFCSDTLFEFGKTYVYLVRSVTAVEGNSIESDDSAPAILTPRDTFPPAAPQNVVAALLPGADDGHIVDLSWSINVENDLAGYRIYRSEKEGERGQLVQPELVPSPAFRDSTVQAGHRYWYCVTAVDHAGNESPASEPTVADLTQPLL